MSRWRDGFPYRVGMSDAAANWYPDPYRRAELRYWDGSVWTEHVSTGGVQSTDPATTSDPGRSQDALDRVDAALTLGNEGKNVADQISGEGIRGAGIEGTVGHGGGSVLDEPVLVVNQKAKLIEISNQYSVFDQHGRQIAAVNQVGQSLSKKLLRLTGNLDQYMTHTLEVTDNTGQVLLRLTRPRKVFKSQVIVENASGHEIGRIAQQNMIGKINFSIESGGVPLGAIRAENWRAWNFRVEEVGGTEVARITKTFEGLAKAMFTTADNYVVQIHHRMPEPFNSLVVASALCIDTALKQDDQG